MNMGNCADLSNGLHLSVDWISWTLTETETVDDAILMMGFEFEDFKIQPRGLNGYRSQMRHVSHSISVQFDGNKNMGIHVDVSGSAVHALLTQFYESHLTKTVFGTDGFETDSFESTVLRELMKEIKRYGHITRLDLAVDDIGTNYYSLPELHDLFISGSYVSRFRGFDEHCSYKQQNEIAGHTIYLGSRKSSAMLRIYDKQAEQNKKLLSANMPPIEYSWVRWELELKRERAQSVLELIVSGQDIAYLTMGILANYLCIMENDRSRKERCTVSEKFKAFIDGIGKISLYSSSSEKTIDDTKKWLVRQVAPSLAKIALADGGCIDFLHYLIDNGLNRLTDSQLEMIRVQSGGDENDTSKRLE